MTQHEPSLPWTQLGWLDQVRDWIHVALTDRHITPEGPVEAVQERPWSSVWKIATSDGTLYFKATAPVLAHEPALTVALAGWRPDCMLDVLAADVDRGWILMRDAGVTMRSLINGQGDWDHWQTVLPLYAGVQLDLVPHSDELLALGVLDRRLSTLPDQVARLLDDVPAMMIGHEDGMTQTHYDRLRALLPQVAAMCDDLAAFELPETLHHEDFHDANIFVRDGRYTFADWGESGIAHPFFSGLVTLRSIAYRADLPFDAPELAALRDAYLAPWAGFGTRDDLVAAFALATKIAMPARALTWYRVIAHLPEPYRSEDAGAVPGWLLEFLEAMEG